MPILLFIALRTKRSRLSLESKDDELSQAMSLSLIYQILRRNEVSGQQLPRPAK